MTNYQEQRACNAWIKLEVLQQLFEGLAEIDTDNCFAGLSDITKSIIYDIRAACDCVKFYPELEQYDDATLQHELERRKPIEARLDELEKEEASRDTGESETPDTKPETNAE